MSTEAVGTARISGRVGSVPTTITIPPGGPATHPFVVPQPVSPGTLVQTPDLAFDVGVCLPDEQAAQAVSSIRQALAGLGFESPDVRHACVANDLPVGMSSKFCAWVDQLKPDADQGMRDRAVQQVDLRQAD